VVENWFHPLGTDWEIKNKLNFLVGNGLCSTGMIETEEGS
jgi:hypothetical protein